jgi:hypothetical protein
VRAKRRTQRAKRNPLRSAQRQRPSSWTPRPGAFPVLHVLQLPSEVAWRTAADSRYWAKAFEIRPVTDSTLCRFAVATSVRQRLAFRNAADRDVRNKFGVRVAGFKSLQIFRDLNDALSNRLYVPVVNRSEEPSCDVDLCRLVRFSHRDYFSRFQTGKVCRGRCHFRIRRGSCEGHHQSERQPLGQEGFRAPLLKLAICCTI